MRRKGIEFVLVLVPVLGALAVTASPAFAERGDMVPVADLPREVRDGADAAAPATGWVIAFRFGKEPEHVWYRMAGRDAADRLLYVNVRRDGVVAEVHTKVSQADVPQVVLRALWDDQPGFVITDNETVGRNSSEIICYRFQGKTVDHREITMLVVPDGQKVCEE